MKIIIKEGNLFVKDNKGNFCKNGEKVTIDGWHGLLSLDLENKDISIETDNAFSLDPRLLGGFDKGWID